MINVAVVIPVYKPVADLNEFEKRSISNCLKKLDTLDVFMVGPGFLKESYAAQYNEVKFQVFKDHFFKSIAGYNQLLKHPVFYLRFQSYSHILIVQTDAWVFGNAEVVKSFTRWDFAGAPSILNGKLRGYNGGLSLRNVSKCLAVLRTFRYHSPPGEVVKRHFTNQPVIKRIAFKWLSVFLDLTVRNNFMYPFNRFVHDNEDIFWSSFVASRCPDFHVIEYGEAVKFAWEHNVAQLYESYPLPFGIHGWWNYNLAFWNSINHTALRKEMGLDVLNEKVPDVHQNH